MKQPHNQVHLVSHKRHEVPFSMPPSNQALWTLFTAAINSTHFIYLIELSLGFQMALTSSRIISWGPRKPFRPSDLRLIWFQNTECNSLYWHSLSLFPKLEMSAQLYLFWLSGNIYFLDTGDNGVTILHTQPKVRCQFPGLRHLLVDVIICSGVGVK